MDKPVLVYRNLNLRGKKFYSIVQNGRVVAHTTQIMLGDCKFIVRKQGQLRVRVERRKNVHALIKGRIAKRGGMGTTAADPNGLPAKIEYNPYKNEGFICKSLAYGPILIQTASVVIINQHGISAAFIT